MRTWVFMKGFLTCMVDTHVTPHPLTSQLIRVCNYSKSHQMCCKIIDKFIKVLRIWPLQSAFGYACLLLRHIHLSSDCVALYLCYTVNLARLDVFPLCLGRVKQKAIWLRETWYMINYSCLTHKPFIL